MKKKLIIISMILILSFIKESNSYNIYHLERIKRYGSFWYSSMNYRSSDLSNASITFLQLKKINLQYSNFSNCIINSTNLSETNLSYCDFSDAEISKSDLHEANLSNSYLNKIKFHKVNLTNANLSNTKLHGARIENTTVTGANFHGALGLTNEQKQYLREHGAINVPFDIEYELDDSEVGHEGKELTLTQVISDPFIKWWYKEYYRDQDSQTETPME